MVNCFESPECFHKKDEDRSSDHWIGQDEIMLTLIGAVSVEAGAGGEWKYRTYLEGNMR